MLGTKPLAHGPLGDISDPNVTMRVTYNTNLCVGILTTNVTITRGGDFGKLLDHDTGAFMGVYFRKGVWSSLSLSPFSARREERTMLVPALTCPPF
jgi:hypothetical protein